MSKFKTVVRWSVKIVMLNIVMVHMNADCQNIRSVEIAALNIGGVQVEADF